MSLEKLIRPKSIAIVGVTDKLGFGRSAALSIVKSKETDRVYYVNPKEKNCLEENVIRRYKKFQK